MTVKLNEKKLLTVTSAHVERSVARRKFTEYVLAVKF